MLYSHPVRQKACPIHCYKGNSMFKVLVLINRQCVAVDRALPCTLTLSWKKWLVCTQGSTLHMLLWAVYLWAYAGLSVCYKAFVLRGPPVVTYICYLHVIIMYRSLSSRYPSRISTHPPAFCYPKERVGCLIKSHTPPNLVPKLYRVTAYGDKAWE